MSTGVTRMLGLILATLLVVHAVPWEFAAIIDADSSISRIHVFKYHMQQGAPYPVVELPSMVHSVAPGLPAYTYDAKHIATGANSLQPLIQFAKTKVPAAQWGRTPIQLLGTGGLRLLQNGTSEKLLAECRKLLAASAFLFAPSWAQVVSGESEGLYGWVGVNFASGALQALAGQPAATPAAIGAPAAKKQPAAKAPTLLGVLQLGSGSLSVTFTPGDKIPDSQAAALKLPGLDRQVYCRTFDGYGLDTALARTHATLLSQGVKRDACLPTGYLSDAGLEGGGSWDGCVARARALLPQERCTFSACALGNEYLPRLAGPWLALDAFAWVAEALALPAGGAGPAPLADLDRVAKAWCARPWQSLQPELHKGGAGGGGGAGSENTLLELCFGAAYSSVLLKEVLKFPAAAAPPTGPALSLLGDVVTPTGVPVEAGYVLGSLVVQVLEAGKPLSQTDAAATASERPAGAVSAILMGALRAGPTDDAGSVVRASLFCFTLIALCVWASFAQVGVVPLAGLPGPRGLRKLRSLQMVALDDSDGDEGGEVARLMGADSSGGVTNGAQHATRRLAAGDGDVFH